MFLKHYQVKAPTGLTPEQEQFWNEEFLTALGRASGFSVTVNERGVQSMVVSFTLNEREAVAAGEWFITKLMMDPATKETGPLWNKKENLPKLVTAAGEYSFFVSMIADGQWYLQIYPVVF